MTAFTVITPKFPLLKHDPKAVESAMKGWAGRVQSKVAKYPPQQPTRYRRTGTLGRGWVQSYGRSGADLVASVKNPVGYAPFVQGSYQTSTMSSKGWPKLSRVGAEEWDRSVSAIKKALGG